MADGAEPQQAPGVAPPLAPVQLFPGRDLLQYMQISSDFMGSINNQLETSTLIAGIHPFNGSSAANYRRWRKDMSRAAIERQPVDHVFMRRLVTRTVTDIAADFWQEVRNNDPNINWPAIQDVFRERFSNFVDAQLSLQTLMKLKQERKQTLHSFAQKIIETAHEAYNDRDYATPIVTRQLRDIFIDGLRCHKTSQHLIREDVPDLPAALNRAVRQELLHQTFKVRLVNTDSEGRHVEDMEVDTVEIAEIESSNKEAPATQRQFEELSASVNAIAQNFKKAQGQFGNLKMIKREMKKNKGKPEIAETETIDTKIGKVVIEIITQLNHPQRPRIVMIPPPHQHPSIIPMSLSLGTPIMDTHSLHPNKYNTNMYPEHIITQIITRTSHHKADHFNLKTPNNRNKTSDPE